MKKNREDESTMRYEGEQRGDTVGLTAQRYGGRD